MRWHAQVAQHMAAASHQQHCLAGAQRLLGRPGHAGVAGDLDAGHGRNLRLRQQPAVAVAQRLVLLRQRGGGQVPVPAGLRHGGPHAGAGQVASQHGHAGAHGRHHHRAIGLPWPGGVVPLQGGLGLRFAGIAWQAPGAVAPLGHLHHHGRQLPARRQPRHGLALQALVVGCIVLLAQQQYIGGKQALQAAGPEGEGGVPVAGA